MTPAETNGGDHAVELIIRESPEASAVVEGRDSLSGEITPLLNQSEKPKINIFKISYPRRKPKEQVIRSLEPEISPVMQILNWIWSGSRYSGFLCMALSSIIYFVMEVFSNTLSAQSIPLFETAFARCMIISILSYSWMRKSGQQCFEPKKIRKFLLLRALLGFLSLSGFIYCIQRLPLSQAIVLGFTTPIMASIAARVILHEKLKVGEVGGLACSFFGVLFIFQQVLMTQGGLGKTISSSYTNVGDSHHVYAVLVGLFSAITGGISYCFIRAAAKDASQPMGTVFAFSLLATPAAGICAVSFEDIVLPRLYSLCLMVILAVLAFFAELLLAQALQLEKTSKAANVQFIEVALLQLSDIGLRRVAPTFGQLVGCLLILGSVCFTIYTGPDKET